MLWDWWIAQLADWVPDGLRRRWSAGNGVVVVTIGGGQPVAHALVGGRRYELGELQLGSPRRPLAPLGAARAGLPQRPTDLALHLLPGAFLRRDLDLPLAAEESLREAVELQIDRLTPFSADDVVFQCGVRDRDPVAKRLGVWLVAAPARGIREVLQWMGESPDLAPRPLRVPPAATEPCVFSYALSRERRAGLGWTLAVVNLALLVAVAVAHRQRGDAELALLEGAVAEVRRDAGEAAELAERVDQMRSAARTVHERRTTRPPLVEVLEDLSARLPDDTYLQRFEVRQNEVRLFGLSATASNLIRQLEESPLLEDVRFEASVTRDAVSGRERFSIVARLGSVAPADAAKGPGT
jgi:general secretion pathway protein L